MLIPLYRFFQLFSWCYLFYYDIICIYSKNETVEIAIWGLSDGNWTQIQNHLVCKRTLENFAKLGKWLSCVLSTYLFGTFHLCPCNDTYAFQNESTLYSCLNVNAKWLKGWIVEYLAKCLSVRLRTKWFWVLIRFQSLKLQISRQFRAGSSLTLRQL